MPDAFDKYYKQLNVQQKKAVDEIEGPVMVIAGPGTGKTQILTLRIANILRKTDTEAQSVLALTFTEAGVVSMRKRLSEMIGTVAFETTITTFHGFASGIIQSYPEYFSKIIGSSLIDEVDQIKILEDIIDKTKIIKLLRPYGDRFHYIRDIKSAISNLKREGISPDDLSVIVKNAQEKFDNLDDLRHEKGPHKGKIKGDYLREQIVIDKNRELSILYKSYSEDLEKKKYFDYDDMIVQTLDAMKNNEELLLILQEQYQYVLVDEHQDTNNAQNKIIELLMSYHDSPNLFIVGDEKQAIFRFQGASLENFNYFKNRYRDSKLIALTDNYRSTQSILNVSSSLMKKLNVSEINLKSKTNYHSRPIDLVVLSSNDVELYYLGKKIINLIESGQEPEEIAVLYRDNKDSFALSRMLQKMNIPFQIESDLDLMHDNDIQKMLNIFRAVEYFGKDSELIPVLYCDIFLIDPLDVHKLLSARVDLKKELTSIVQTKSILQDLELETRDQIVNLVNNLKKWKTASRNKSLLELFDLVVVDSDLLLSMLSRDDSVEALQKMAVFLDHIKSFLESNHDATLSEFISHIESMKEHRLMIRRTLTGSRIGKVRLMTAHRSKGLEFDYVFIVNAFYGHWGDRFRMEKLPLLSEVYSLTQNRRIDTKDDLDERNLFYVALTRGKKHVTISLSRVSLDGREQMPSRFITDLDDDLISQEKTDKIESDFQQKTKILFSKEILSKNDIKSKEFINHLFEKRGFAVTHLNNYLKCPWQYFFVNLLLVPKSPEPPLMYGIAVHGALKDMFDYRQREGKFDKELLISRFAHYLEQQPFSKSEYNDFSDRGASSLGGYYDEYVKTWKYPSLSEFKINGVQLSPKVVLTGSLDRIDIVDSDKNLVVVTDYKTGKPKSRNDIEGKTRKADSSYKRQLVFYNLLLNSYQKGKYKMHSGVIDFVEPNETGKYKKEIFEITKDEVKELKKEILAVTDQILNLSFWDKTCQDRECRWCELSKSLK